MKKEKISLKVFILAMILQIGNKHPEIHSIAPVDYYKFIYELLQEYKCFPKTALKSEIWLFLQLLLFLICNVSCSPVGYVEQAATLR